jgi:hypothetical protein
MYKVVVVGKCFILNVHYSNHLFLLIFVLYENFQVHYKRKVFELNARSSPSSTITG